MAKIFQIGLQHRPFGTHIVFPAWAFLCRFGVLIHIAFTEAVGYVHYWLLFWCFNCFVAFDLNFWIHEGDATERFGIGFLFRRQTRSRGDHWVRTL